MAFDWIGAANAAGSILGGLGIGNKGTSRKRERDSARIASEEALRHARLAPSAAVEGFKAAGIHPLFGLTGTSGITSMPSYSTPGGDPGPDFGAVGQGIARAASVFTGKEEREVAAASAKLGLENQQLQNDYLRTQIRHMNAPGTPPGLTGRPFMPGQGDSVDARYPEQSAMRLGYGDTAPLLKEGIDPFGRPVSVYNEDGLGDNDLLSSMISLGLSLPQMVANMGKATGDWLRKPRYDRKWYHSRYVD